MVDSTVKLFIPQTGPLMFHYDVKILTVQVVLVAVTITEKSVFQFHSAFGSGVYTAYK